MSSDSDIIPEDSEIIAKDSETLGGSETIPWFRAMQFRVGPVLL
jgi:hypothetical protein